MSSRAPRDLGPAPAMPTDDAIFIPLCGLREAIVIPTDTGPRIPGPIPEDDMRFYRLLYDVRHRGRLRGLSLN